MEPANYTYYEINLADIWEYEREQFINGKSAKEHARELMDIIQLYVIKHTNPIFGISMHLNGSEEKKAYYSRIVHDYTDHIRDLNYLYHLDYFINKHDCYSYNNDIIVNLNHKDFPYFFALKLRQYSGNLFEVNNFLSFQLKKSFNNNAAKYLEFLDTLLLQYPSFLTESIKISVNKFKTNPRLKARKTKKTIGTKKKIVKNTVDIQTPKPTTWQYALYYVYIIESNEHKRLDEIAGLKQDAFAIIVTQLGISANSFEQHYDFYLKKQYRIGKIDSNIRTLKKIKDDIQFVINHMLAKYPNALALAQSDLSQIESFRNPITNVT